MSRLLVPGGAQSRIAFWLHTVASHQEEHTTVSGEALRSISVPDRVDSRLGTHDFVDGFPTEIEPLG